MATLRLLYVDCINEQEPGSGDGNDEIYFTFKNNGDSSEGRSNIIRDMDVGERFYLTDRFDFSETVRVRLYEYDKGANDDERIDSVTLAFVPADAGDNQTMTFKGAGAEYDVRYEILA